MENKNTLFMIILISVCVFCIFFTVFLFRHTRKIESEYNEKEATFIRESMDLKDWIDDMKITLSDKTKEIDAVKSEKKLLAEKVKSVEEENKKLEELYRGQIEILEKEKEELQKEIKILKEIPLVEAIQKARDAEEDENIKKLLERTLENIKLIKSGNIVDLEPIIVAEEGKGEVLAAALLPVQAIAGEILSVDRNSNLIVINLGTEDRIQEGMRLAILDGEEEIASGEIISPRHKISAAFIDDIKYNHTIDDIKNGYKVLMGKE